MYGKIDRTDSTGNHSFTDRLYRTALKIQGLIRLERHAAKKAAKGGRYRSQQKSRIYIRNKSKATVDQAKKETCIRSAMKILKSPNLTSLHRSSETVGNLPQAEAFEECEPPAVQTILISWDPKIER